MYKLLNCIPALVIAAAVYVYLEAVFRAVSHTIGG